MLLLLGPRQHLWAQAPAESPRIAYEAQIRELLEITGSAKMGIQVLDQLVDSFKKAAPQVPDSFWDEFRADVDGDLLADMVVPIYARHFTEAEIEAMLAFYRTEEGQSVVRKLPLVMQESMAAGRRLGQKLAERALARLKERGYTVNL